VSGELLKIKGVIILSSVVIICYIAAMTMMIVATTSPRVLLAQQSDDSSFTSATFTNPFGAAYEGPPRIILIYNNTEYYGVLDSYSFEKAETMNNLPLFDDKVISTIPNDSITVKNGSIVKFSIKGNAPPEAQSDSLSVNAYTINGKPVKVLKVADESQKTSFVVDLQEGREYILMAVATWLPEEDTEKIIGYCSYSYKIKVIS
jgi:hypothetical protein